MHIMTIFILTMFLDINCLPSYHWLVHSILLRDFNGFEMIIDRLKENKINPANAGV